MGFKRRSLIKIAAGLPVGVAQRRGCESGESRLDSAIGPIGYGGVSPRAASSDLMASTEAGNSESTTDDAGVGTNGRNGDTAGYGAPAYGTPSE